jgi:hypothetical protein
MSDDESRKPRLFRALLIAVAAFMVGAASLYATQKSNFTIGTAVGTELSSCVNDPKGVKGNCWGLNISCPNVNAFLPYDATLKITSPTGSSVGTIIFISGGGSTYYYDTFTYGTSLIDDVAANGFTAVQIAFNNPVAGWLTGPATDGNGPISLACLPATAMKWVYTNVLTAGTPLCATGNSGGAFAIAYGLSYYGLDSILTLAEPTSGPELSRMDYGCAPKGKFLACAVCGSGTQDETYGLANAEQYIDPAYTGVMNMKADGPCSEDVNGSTRNAAQLHHDSILSDTYSAQFSFTTAIRVLFGGQDLSGGGVPEGLDWVSFITSPITVVCVPMSGHEMANSLSGATQIESDLTTYCKLP